jgi:hypothetical protein
MAIRNESDLERAMREFQSLREAAKDTTDSCRSMALDAEIPKKAGGGPARESPPPDELRQQRRRRSLDVESLMEKA